ncbi:MAG: hypothetical protein O7G87_14290 [bacterium]|nr:hypothetical protein [bacterium]
MLHWQESDGLIHIETPHLKAAIRTEGYVSGTMAGTLVDKKTGATDPSFGLHIMDFLLAPGWRDDAYHRDRLTHGNLPKHYVEGPQICTRAQKLDYTVISGENHLALKQRFTFHQPGENYETGSRWEQTLLFLPDTRYYLSCETITSANTVDNLFYRIDMPGHLKHDRGDTFHQIYLSYHGTIGPESFHADFAPDDRFFYARNDAQIPERFIRAHQLRASSAPWLAGMTLDPSAPCEAWCHQRGYVCFIQELHRRPTQKGETIGAAYVVGYFDTIEDMNRTYDRFKGINHISVDDKQFTLLNEIL